MVVTVGTAMAVVVALVETNSILLSITTTSSEPYYSISKQTDTFPNRLFFRWQ